MKFGFKPWQIGVLIISGVTSIALCVAAVAIPIITVRAYLPPPGSVDAPPVAVAPATIAVQTVVAELVAPPLPSPTPFTVIVPTATLVPTSTAVPTETATAILLPPTPALPEIGACAAFNERVPARVVEVMDGSTIKVEMGGQNYTLKYIGLEIPQPGDPNWTGASNFNASLVKDQVVTLVKDISEIDSLGQLLRYVFVGEAFVNYELLRQGYATASSYPPDTACDFTFQAGQLEAQANNAGIWAMAVQPTVPKRLPPTMPVFTVPTVPVFVPPQPPVGNLSCNCSGGDYLDCPDFGTHARAQACFETCMSEGYGDVFRLDGDGDGLACEDLP